MTNVQTRMFANEFPARPKFFTDSIAKRTAELLLPEVRRWLGNEAGTDNEIVADLVDAINYGLDDGYEIAKRLERRGYSPDTDLCDVLDSVGHHQHKAHKEEVMEWVRAHDLKLDLPVGASVSVEVEGKQRTGEIRDHYTETAEYSVFIAELGHVRKGIGTHGVILGFEKVKAA